MSNIIFLCVCLSLRPSSVHLFITLSPSKPLGGILQSLPITSSHSKGVREQHIFFRASVHLFVYHAFSSCSFFSSVGAPFAMSSAKRNSSSTSVCTLDLACNLLRLKSFPSKRYLIGISLSSSVCKHGRKHHAEQC